MRCCYGDAFNWWAFMIDQLSRPAVRWRTDLNSQRQLISSVSPCSSNQSLACQPHRKGVTRPIDDPESRLRTAVRP